MTQHIQTNLRLFLVAILIFIFALLIRIEYFSNTKVYNPLSGDASSYLVYAKNLKTYNIFSKQRGTTSPKPDAYWAVGYPVFLVLIGEISILFDSNFYFTLMVSQAVLGVLVVLLTYLIGLYFLNQYLAISAAILTALSPHLISLGNYILTETLFSFILLLSLYLFISLLKYKKTYLTIMTGLSFGLTYLVNPVVFFAPLFLIILFYFSSEKTVQTKKLSMYILISFMTIILAWSARDHLYVEAGQPTSFSRALTNLIIGSHHDFFEIWRANPRDPNNPATLDAEVVKGSVSTFLPILFERIKAEPTHYAKWYFLEKPYSLWSWNILFGQGDIYVYAVSYSLYNHNNLALASYTMMKSAHLWLCIFAVMGLFFVFRMPHGHSKMTVLTLYITVIYISAVYVVLQAEPRYSVPLRPEMYLCAMFFIMGFLNTLRKAKS